MGGKRSFGRATVNGRFVPSTGGGDLLPEGRNRVAQSVVLGLQSGNLLALLIDLLLLLLNYAY